MTAPAMEAFIWSGFPEYRAACKQGKIRKPDREFTTLGFEVGLIDISSFRCPNSYHQMGKRPVVFI